MPSPFPGMNPYLEHPTFWSSFHTRLMVAIADVVAPQLNSQYYVEVESRTYQSDESDAELLIGIPDAVVFAQQADEPFIGSSSLETAPTATELRPQKVIVPMPTEVRERYLEVREMKTDAVITVVELLSPTNKRSGEGRAAYEKKRRLVLGSDTHLVEIDLLRGGKPMSLRGIQPVSTYRILVSRSQQRPTADLYEITLQQPLPNFPIPLKPEDPEPIVPLQEVFQQLFERARYGSRIDYRRPLPPPNLSQADQLWIDALLAPLRGE
ncbi:MAG: DUF4058 family protein [Leptolyngbyaceae cyanobacterium SM1_4_3]|nr:DUF4058 family protein [Leptolyngbyaceae cyanobacterium SM1_4_3]NJN91455.1 DUF4058 family protein [Leptolyngbyaceae cyanobacterium SL_5_14]